MSPSPDDSAAQARGAPQQAARCGEFVRAGVMLALLFGAVFYGADHLAGLRTERYRLYFAWERGIPFVPFAYGLYYSVFAVPFLVPLLVPTADLVRQWRNRMAIAIAVAGALFLLFPTEAGFDDASSAGWAGVRRITAIVAGQYNLVPSLHVGLTLVTLHALWPHVGRRGRRLLVAWAVALGSSTLLTHQHHLLDVAAGLLLGWAVCRKVGVD